MLISKTYTTLFFVENDIRTSKWPEQSQPENKINNSDKRTFSLS